MSFINRFTDNTKGAITFIGNTLGLSQETNTNNAGTAGSIGAFVNRTIGTSANATWPVGTTFSYTQNNSDAILSLPTGTKVLYAELIWGGNYLSRDQNISSVLNNPVTFITPTGTFSITRDPLVGGEVTFTSAGVTVGGYVRSQNVTSIIQASGNGVYATSGVPGLIDPLNASTIDTNVAGWTLAVVYEDITQPMRNLTLFSGIDLISSAVNPFTDVIVSGFSTSVAGPVNGRVLLSAGEGDAVIPGDSALFGINASSLVTLTGPNNPATNFFCSQINNDNGLINTTGTFGNRNQNALAGTNISAGRQGWDITNVDGTAGLTNSQTSAVLRLTTTGDAYVPNGIGIQIDINAPSFIPFFKLVNKNFGDVGDIITYTFPLTNTGDILAENILLVDTLPSSVTFVPNSVTIDGVSSPGATPLPGISVNNIPAKNTSTVTFNVIIKDTIPSPNPIPNLANVVYDYVAGPGIPRQRDSLISNTVTTYVNSCYIQLNKMVNKAYADIGGQLTYTITLSNTGTTTATNVVFKDTIPSQVSFIPNTFTENGVTIVSGNPLIGVNLNNIGPGKTSTVTFIVTVTTIPSPNPIKNDSISTWSYVVDPSTPIVKSNNNMSNVAVTTINNAILSNVKSVDKPYADCNDVITYTIVLSNSGNICAQNILFKDTIPSGTTFISNSVILNGVIQPGANPQSGININSILAGASATISFMIRVEC